MSQRQQIHVHINRLVSDQPVEEGALRAALAAELGGQLAGEPPRLAHPDAGESAAARAVARRVGGLLTNGPGGEAR